VRRASWRTRSCPFPEAHRRGGHASPRAASESSSATDNPSGEITQVPEMLEVFPGQRGSGRFSVLTFYLLLPATMLFFAWKAAVFPTWGSGLLCVAAGAIASHATLPLRGVSRRTRALLSVGVAILAGGAILSFGPLRRPFDLYRANLSAERRQSALRQPARRQPGRRRAGRPAAAQGRMWCRRETAAGPNLDMPADLTKQ
jgi:hypothetical protein